MPDEEAHGEACRWEHVMSEAVELKVYQLLGRPTRSPYGNPIPGLAELDGSDGAAERVASVADVAAVAGVAAEQNLADPDVAGTVVVSRISESVQTDATV